MVSRARRAAAECADAPAWAVPDDELVTCLQQAWAGVQQLTAAAAHLVRQAEARGLPSAQAATSMVVWLRQVLRVTPATAQRLARLAETLDVHPALDVAVCAGQVSAEQATAIGAALTDLPAEVGAEVVDKAEAMLVGWADEFDPIALSRLGERILTHVAPEVAERRDGDALARQEARAHRRRAFTLSPVGGGSVRLTGWLDETGAAMVNAALDPLCHPRHDGDAAPRTPAQRRADALVDICAAAHKTPDAPSHGGDATEVVVTIPLATLSGASVSGAAPASASPASGSSPGASEPGGAPSVGISGAPQPHAPGRLDSGATISVAEARRLACDARIVPAVLSGDGHVLDLGRARRLFTGPLRRALILRDGGCTFPGCDRPAR